MLRIAIVLAGLLAAPAFAATTIDGVAVDFEKVGEGFSRPVEAVALPGDGRLLVVEKTGTVRFLEDGAPGAVFLDLGAEVSDGNEQGLLGLAFDPEFGTNGQLYVNYTDADGDTQIVRFIADGGVADPASGEVLLSIDQPQGNHNGGWIAFGPDGMLYIGMGDGGGGGDRHGLHGNGQNKDMLLGKILRIDTKGDPYAIPAGNPFANGGGAPEVFLYGVRNPWRNAFDGNLLYVADVGQNAWEEVSVVDVTTEAGANLGWRWMEGPGCYPSSFACEPPHIPNLKLPVHVYGHDVGCSITGGIVYRGATLPALQGRYFFADYCSGVIEGFRLRGQGSAGLVNTSDDLGSIGNVTSFGTDAQGEMLVVTDDGLVFKMVPG
ncbi:MAG: PQQ-dependent sugar dehydrogenase [Devosia sp.]